MSNTSPSWQPFEASCREPHDAVDRLPAPPPWRPGGSSEQPPDRGEAYQISQREADAVNAALCLRRPLLVEGPPGIGKSTLAYAVARQLGLGPVLSWPINSRSTVKDALYSYDAIGRLYATQIALAEKQLNPERQVEQPDIGRFLRLGPLGSAFVPTSNGRPRALLIDEIDKGDIDLPNDLLALFEEGWFEIPELSRIQEDDSQVKLHNTDARAEPEPCLIKKGVVSGAKFPFVLITSNRERDLPPAFLRRCLRLSLEPPDAEQLAAIVRSWLGRDKALAALDLGQMIDLFVERREEGYLATDQLLNMVQLALCGVDAEASDKLRDVILRALGPGDA